MLSPENSQVLWKLIPLRLKFLCHKIPKPPSVCQQFQVLVVLGLMKFQHTHIRVVIPWRRLWQGLVWMVLCSAHWARQPWSLPSPSFWHCYDAFGALKSGLLVGNQWHLLDMCFWWKMAKPTTWVRCSWALWLGVTLDVHVSFRWFSHSHELEHPHP